MSVGPIPQEKWLATPPKLSKNELDAVAIGYRNSGRWFMALFGKDIVITLDQWLDREYDKYGYDKADKPRL